MTSWYHVIKWTLHTSKEFNIDTVNSDNIVFIDNVINNEQKIEIGYDDFRKICIKRLSNMTFQG